MNRLYATLCLLPCCAALAQQDVSVFTPPKAYPVDRYEAGWGKNPFTLKTAPVVVGNVSFAKDLAIAGISGDTANPTVTIVNVKTHERFRLKHGQPADNGMRLSQVKRAGSRKDSVVEVMLGSETSELHYDSSYLKQVASTAAVRTPQGTPQARQQPVPLPGQLHPQTPGQPSIKVPMPAQPPGKNGLSASTGTPALVPPGLQGIVPSSAFVQSAPQTDGSAKVDITVSANPAGGNLTVSTGAQGSISAPISSQVVSAAPVPVRRRMITPVSNPLPVQQ